MHKFDENFLYRANGSISQGLILNHFYIFLATDYPIKIYIEV